MTSDAFRAHEVRRVGQLLAEEIERRTGKEAAPPCSAHPRGRNANGLRTVRATRFGVHAVRAVPTSVRPDGRLRYGHRPGSDRGGDRELKLAASATQRRDLLRLKTCCAGRPPPAPQALYAYQSSAPRPHTRALAGWMSGSAGCRRMSGSAASCLARKARLNPVSAGRRAERLVPFLMCRLYRRNDQRCTPRRPYNSLPSTTASQWRSRPPPVTSESSAP